MQLIQQLAGALAIMMVKCLLGVCCLALKQLATMACVITRVGQNHICALYMTVCLVISLPKLPYIHGICRVGQNHTFIGIYGVHTVFLAGKSPYIRSYTVQIYGSGQPYVYVWFWSILVTTATV
jgi:hypothetical protein